MSDPTIKQPSYKGRPRRWLGELLRSYERIDPPSGLTVLQATVQVLLDNTDWSDAEQAELYARLVRDAPKGDT